MSHAYKLWILTVVAACWLTGCSTVRQTLDMSLVPVATEIKLGRQLSAQIERQQRLLPDERIQRYVSDISRPLLRASHVGRSDLRYRIAVLDDPQQVNAFALPGGFISAYSGLLLFAQNEAKIAGVLAHEIGHVMGRARYRSDRVGTTRLQDVWIDDSGSIRSARSAVY